MGVAAVVVLMRWRVLWALLPEPWAAWARRVTVAYGFVVGALCVAFVAAVAGGAVWGCW